MGTIGTHISDEDGSIKSWISDEDGSDKKGIVWTPRGLQQ